MRRRESGFVRICSITWAIWSTCSPTVSATSATARRRTGAARAKMLRVPVPVRSPFGAPSSSTRRTNPAPRARSAGPPARDARPGGARRRGRGDQPRRREHRQAALDRVVQAGDPRLARAGHRDPRRGDAPRDEPPALFLSGSASGVYGDRPVDVLDDDAEAGRGFLADVCTQWEAAATAAPEGVRVVLLRTGIVVGQGGGALAPLVPLTKAGLGGKLGTGGQFWPWIALEDEVGAIVHLATSPEAADVRGPVNLAGPEAAVSNRITRRVAEDLHRPYLFSVPAFALRTLLREAADEMLLSSQRMVPRKLTGSGYRSGTSAPRTRSTRPSDPTTGTTRRAGGREARGGHRHGPPVRQRVAAAFTSAVRIAARARLRSPAAS
ncbi:hypothetical protein Pfo_031601 [Paulownia fortunei]|nr:hypothetical protein Pfo_031601 [Paulownia fortunei]